MSRHGQNVPRFGTTDAVTKKNVYYGWEDFGAHPFHPRFPIGRSESRVAGDASALRFLHQHMEDKSADWRFCCGTRRHRLVLLNYRRRPTHPQERKTQRERDVLPLRVFEKINRAVFCHVCDPGLHNSRRHLPEILGRLFRTQRETELMIWRNIFRVYFRRVLSSRLCPQLRNGRGINVVKNRPYDLETFLTIMFV